MKEQKERTKKDWRERRDMLTDLLGWWKSLPELAAKQKRYLSGLAKRVAEATESAKYTVAEEAEAMLEEMPDEERPEESPQISPIGKRCLPGILHAQDLKGNCLICEST